MDISIYYNLKHKKHTCKSAIANDFKLNETNSVKMKKKIIEKSYVISVFSSEFTLKK